MSIGVFAFDAKTLQIFENLFLYFKSSMKYQNRIAVKTTLRHCEITIQGVNYVCIIFFYLQTQINTH